MIKLLCLDLDGTITDGLYHVFDNGLTMKSFYTRDFYALSELKKHDIKVLILTQSFGKCIQAKLDNIIDEWKSHIELAVRIDNKYKFLDNYIKQRDIEWHEVAYMGDSENDLKCMEAAALKGCPADAISTIKDESYFISEKPGGRGAVYDFRMKMII